MGLEKEVFKYKNGNKKSFDYIYKETVGLVRFAIYQSIPNKYIVEDFILSCKFIKFFIFVGLNKLRYL